MQNVNLPTEDIDAVTEGIKRLGPDVRGYGTVDPTWSRPTAVLVIDCVLSLNRKYDAFVVPRLDAFAEKHPDINTINELASLMESYRTPHTFMRQELNFNYKKRANILQSVVDFVCKIVEETPHVPEEETLKQWAINAKPDEHRDLNISGFGIAGFQYLRMLFGADTTKPDVHIIRFVSSLLDRNVSAFEALNILEASSAKLKISVRDVDAYIWDRGARGQQDATDTNTNKKTKAGYSEFWAPIRDGNSVFSGKPVPIRDESQIIKTIHGIEVCLRLNNHECYVQLWVKGSNRLKPGNEVEALFPKSDFIYTYKETRYDATVLKFPILDKGKNDRDDWNEIREALVTMGTDIYNKISESDL